jgi:hypothetical protein
MLFTISSLAFGLRNLSAFISFIYKDIDAINKFFNSPLRFGMVVALRKA